VDVDATLLNQLFLGMWGWVGDEVGLHYDTDGVHVQFMDPSRIMLADIKITGEGYKPPKIPIRVGVNVEDLSSLIKKTKSKKGAISLQIPDHAAYIEIIREGDTQKIATVDLPTIEPILNLKEHLDTIIYDSKVSIPPGEFKKIIYKSIPLYEKTASFSVKDNELSIRTEDMEMKIPGASITGDSVGSTHPLRFLKPIVDLTKKNIGEITFSLRRDHPLKVEFSNDQFQAKIYLAPKYEGDEEYLSEYDDMDEFYLKRKKKRKNKK